MTGAARPLIIALVVVTLVGAASSAHACMKRGGPSAADHLLRRADRALEQGDYLESRRLASIALETAADVVERDGPDWMLAMSWVRDESASRTDLVRAAETMRRIRSHRLLSDVVSRVDLAEALSRLPEGEEEALSILMPLVRADLVGSPHAYAALARITDDEHTRTLARTRCVMMAEESTFCAQGFTTSIERRDRWGARLLVATLASTGALLLAAFVVLVLRVRQRSRTLARLHATLTTAH